MAASDALPAKLRAEHEGLVPAQYSSDRHTLLVTFGFRCNLACVFCMVEDVLDKYEGTSLETLRRFVGNEELMRGIHRVTFSGGEATLERSLPDYVRAARSAPGVRHVRVQTNATLLRNHGLLEGLLTAGVDEVFVSLHGADAETCDGITQRAGSFEGIVEGMRAVSAAGAALYTNTVVVEPNYRALTKVVELVAPFGPRGMEFWNLWPRVDPHDERRMYAPFGDVQPHLIAALDACLARGIAPVVKWFPRCLLGAHAVYQDDSQPTVLVEQTYWEKAPEFACLYQGVCAEKEHGCAGLTHTYIRRFGWEEQLLRPVRAPLPAGGGKGKSHDARETPDEVAALGDPAAARSPLAGWLAAHGIPLGSDAAGWTVARGELRDDSLRIVLVRGEQQLTAELLPRDPQRRAFASTASFDLRHLPAPGLEPELAPALRALAERLTRADSGGRKLPGAGGSRGRDA